MSWLFSQALVEAYSDRIYSDGEWFAKYNRAMCLWRTAQCSFLEDLEQFSATWPRQGMTVDGYAYLLPKSAQNISATESGLWATPTTMDKLPPKSQVALQKEATVARPGRSRPANLRDQVCNMQNWPTPTRRDYKGTSKKRVKGHPRHAGNLDSVVELETGEIAGRLNPTWLEWLMGWPLGWTELKPLAMDKFQQWRKQHGSC